MTATPLTSPYMALTGTTLLSQTRKDAHEHRHASAHEKLARRHEAQRCTQTTLVRNSAGVLNRLKKVVGPGGGGGGVGGNFFKGF